MGEKLKNKYILLIVLLSIVLIAMIGIATMVFFYGKNLDDFEENKVNNPEQNTETQNIINNEEENIIKVIIDNEQNNPEEGNQNEENTNTIDTNNTAQKNNNPSSEGGSNMKNQDNTSKYYIKINNQMNVVTIYQKDSKGQYTVPVKAMICSIGTATPTSGVYKTSDKYTWRLLQGNVYGQYAVRITGHILFHSVPYTYAEKYTLEWWEYDKLGTKASLGCIRLTVQDAKWIFDHCPKGTQVEFYYDSDPGPLGKPTAKKISSYSEELKNWDPTDPDRNNPWKNYKEPVVETEPEEVLPPQEDVPVVTPPEEMTPTPEQTPSESPEEKEETKEPEEPEKSEGQTEQDKNTEKTEQTETLGVEQAEIEI